MGATNVRRVYIGWSSSLRDRPFKLLAFMALTSVDDDAEPWFGMSHQDIAELALGLRVPKDGDGPGWQKDREQVLRIVRRHISPLFDWGAIETTRRGTGGHLSRPVVYRLYLDGPDYCAPAAVRRVAQRRIERALRA